MKKQVILDYDDYQDLMIKLEKLSKEMDREAEKQAKLKIEEERDSALYGGYKKLLELPCRKRKRAIEREMNLIMNKYI